MSIISTTDARNFFTKELVAFFSDRVRPKKFFQSFFVETVSATKEISIEVERDAQTVAVDVIRGTEGNRNTWDKQTEKIFVPPFYDEFFDATQLQAYEALYVEPEISSVNFGKFLKTAQAKMEGLVDKIERAYEVQCVQALVDGIVQLKSGVNIDFKRKAASLVPFGAANDWSLATVDPNTIILQACEFEKTVGKVEGAVFNMIMGGLAYNAYLNNNFVKGRALAMQYGLDSIVPAQRNALGQAYHGQISVGSYRVNLWSYPETYKDPSTGVTVKYMPEKKILILPEVTNNVLSYAAVPQLLSTGIAPVKSKMLAYEYIDGRRTAHQMGFKSAGVAIPVAVDQAFTAQVLA